MNIERPVTNSSNNANSKSLYQQTMSTIEQLYSIPGFEFYLFPEGVANLMKNNDGNPMIDPVAVLWGCFRLGAPLCHLMNAFNTVKKLDVPDVSGLTTYNNTCKKCIYFFLLACKEELTMTDDSLFTITELYRDDTNGFVKVLGTINKVLEELHKRQLFPPLRKLPFLDNKNKESPMDNRSKVIQELLVTERKYINDLQVLQEYENELKKNPGVGKDLIVSIFGNLGELLDFQRRFLIAMEATLALPFEEQRIGALFVSNEDAFSVYVPICGNYESAIELARKEAEILKGSMDPVVTLPSYLIKPVQRVCKYPLLLNEIIKLSSSEAYPHLEELKRGLDVVKRVADRVNEMTRKNENRQLKENLRSWVSDWKYFDLDGAGELLLSDRFLMSTPDGDKEYHVFLFENVLLCCKDQTKKLKKKRFSAKDDQHSYALRGNIFMSSVIEVVNSSKPAEQSFNLRIYWKDVADMESFSLKCKNEEQVILWKQRLEKVIMDEKNRKRRTNDEKSLYGAHLSTSASNLRYSVESTRSWEDSEKSYDRYSNISARSNYSSPSPADLRQTQERRARAASLNQNDRSSSFVVRPTRPQTFGAEQEIKRNSDSIRYSPLSPVGPPQMALPVPGQYVPGQAPSARTSIDILSAKSSSIFRKTPSMDSLGRLSLHDERRGSNASLHSPTMLSNSASSFTSGLLKVKVFYGSDIFVIALPGICSYKELLSKIERKIQLAGTNLPEGHPMKLRYKDEDGDFIQIFGDDDLLLAFDVCRHLGDSNKGIMHLFVE